MRDASSELIIGKFLLTKCVVLFIYYHTTVCWVVLRLYGSLLKELFSIVL